MLHTAEHSHEPVAVTVHADDDLIKTTVTRQCCAWEIGAIPI